MLGASIFVPENKILVENAKKFGLVNKLEKYVGENEDEDEGFGMFTILAAVTNVLVGTGHNSYTLIMGNPATIGKLRNSSASTDSLRLK